MGIFRRTKKRKTAFLRLFRSIFLFFVDKILRTECGRFRLAGFTGKRKKRRTGGFRLLSSCEKAFRLSFDFFGRRVRRLLGIEAASRGEWTILEGMGLTF